MRGCFAFPVIAAAVTVAILTGTATAGGGRPALFAQPSPACACLPVCKCSPCKCEHPTASPPIIGALPIAFDAEGRVEAVGNTCYETCRKLAIESGRPLVVLIGHTPPALAAHAKDNPVIYSAAADPMFPQTGLYRYDHGSKVGKAAGLWRTASPQAAAGSPRQPACRNGKCRLQ